MPEYFVCALRVAAAQTDGEDCHAANVNNGKSRHDDHRKGQREVDRTKSVCSNAPANEYSVHHRKQEKADTAQHSRQNVFDHIFMP